MDGLRPARGTQAPKCRPMPTTPRPAGDNPHTPIARSPILILRHAFDPRDNARLASLCGSLDEHLRSIEGALEVSVSRRNEFFRIEGLTKLYPVLNTRCAGSSYLELIPDARCVCFHRAFSAIFTKSLKWTPFFGPRG